MYVSNSFLQLFKGPDKKIKELGLADGRLSFATDTKRIYLDCDFTDSEERVYSDRLAFGGSSGIFYGDKTFSEEEIAAAAFEFVLADLDGAEDLPQKDDLILNSDGCFYRVINLVEAHIDEETNQEVPFTIVTDKLTVAGSGGGGGGGAGGLVAKRIDGQKKYFTASDGSIPIQYCVLSKEEDATVDMTIVIRGNTVGTITNVPQSLTEPATVDLWRYRNYFVVNGTTDISLRFVDSYMNTRVINYSNYFSYIDLRAEVRNGNLGTTTNKTVSIQFNPYSPAPQTMAERYFCFEMMIPGRTIPEKWKIADKVVSNNNTFSYEIDLGVNPAQGSYQVTVWIEGKMSADDEEYMTSDKKYIYFTYQAADSSVPLIDIHWNETNYIAKSKPGRLMYTVSYPQTPTSIVTIDIMKDNNVVATREVTVTHGATSYWDYVFQAEGEYYAKLTWGQNRAITGTTPNPAIVTPAEGAEIPGTYTSGLLVNLSASGRSNNEVQKNKWISEINTRRVDCLLDAFNWVTNGWMVDSSGDTYLHLSNGASLTVNYAPFATVNSNGQDPLYNGKTIELDFRLSNVRDTTQILGQAASFISDSTGKQYINNGIICQGDKISLSTSGIRNYYPPDEEAKLDPAVLAATAGARAYLTSDKRIHVSFAIEGHHYRPNTEDTYPDVDKMIFTYIDGVLSGIKAHSIHGVEPTDTLKDNRMDQPQYLTFRSDYADIDIYHIRIYDGCLTEETIRSNYVADFNDYDTQQRLFTDNDLLDDNGNILLDKVIAAGNIPYFIFEDGRKTEDKKGTGGVQENEASGARLPYHKKDFRWVESYYVDPLHPERNIGDWEGKVPVNAVIYAQGTSSLQYPVKNLRYRIVNKNQAYAMHFTNNSNVTTVMDPVQLFTLKADYMESAMAHNTGSGNVLQELYANMGLESPPQQYFDTPKVNNIVGNPCLAFFRPHGELEYTFIGRYNFNLDKGEPTLFGFQNVKTADPTESYGLQIQDGQYADSYEAVPMSWDKSAKALTEKFKNTLDGTTYYIRTPGSAIDAMQVFSSPENKATDAAFKAQWDLGPIYKGVKGSNTIQCWEFLNNSYDLCGFRQAWDEVADYQNHDAEKNLPFASWRGAFESRYPEYANKDVESDKRAFAKFVNWVVSTDQTKATDAPLPSPVTIGTTTYTNDTAKYRLALFTRDFDQHMNKQMTLFYYVFTELILGIDNRGKNMMMASYNVNNVTGDATWFPIFYDMDTILGVNNQGTLIYPYYAEDTDANTFNACAAYYTTGLEPELIPNYSTLWCNFREAFYGEIKQMFNDMKTAGMTYANLVKWYNDRQADAFQMVHINKDSKYKYIDPLTQASALLSEDDYNAGNTETVSMDTYDGTNAAQGTRSLHRDFWLNHRFTYLSSKYPDTYNTSSADIAYRAYAGSIVEGQASTVPADYGYTFTSTNIQYADYSYAQDAAATPVRLLPNVPTRGEPLPNITTINQEFYLFNLGDIYDIGDLSTKYIGDFVINRPIRLTKLKFGNDDPGYNNSHLAEGWNKVINSLTKVPLLRELDVTNCSVINGRLNLGANQYIETVRAAGTKLTEIQFANGGSLQKLIFPNTINTFRLLHNTFNTANDKEMYEQNRPQDASLVWGNIANLRNLLIEGCPGVDTKFMLQQLAEAKGLVALENNTTQILDTFRLADVNWTFNEDECEIGASGESNGLIIDIPIVKYLSNVTQGYNVQYNQVLKQKTNNEYFAGTIFINNTPEHQVDTLALTVRYAYVFPNLKFECNYAARPGYSLDFVDEQGNTFKQSATNEAHWNSYTFSEENTNALVLATYIREHTSIPAPTQNEQYDKYFIGWTTDEAKESTLETDLNNWLSHSIEVVYNDEGQITNVIDNLTYANGTKLSTADYDEENHFKLYPIRRLVTRKFEVRHHKYAKNSQQAQALADPDDDLLAADVYIIDPDGLYYLNNGQYTLTNAANKPSLPEGTIFYRLERQTVQLVEYGAFASVPDDQPTNIVFNADGTAGAYAFKQYNYDCSSYAVFGEVNNYPEFESEIQDLKDLPSPQSYFDVEVISNRNTDIAGIDFTGSARLTLKNNITAPAISVPTTVVINRTTYPVYEFRLNRTEALPETLKRIYFAAAENNNSNPVKVISTTATSIGGVVENTTLDYIDLRNVDLRLIDSYTFAKTTNMRLVNNALPVTLTYIEQRAFQSAVKVDLVEMPQNLVSIGINAFRGATGLTEINFSTATNLREIKSEAFINCTNLTGSTLNNSLPTSLRIIGDSAFSGCSNLTLCSTNGRTSLGLEYIGDKAFANCRNLTFNVDFQVSGGLLERIGAQAFLNCGKLGINSFPESVRIIDRQAFSGSAFNITSADASRITFKNYNMSAWTLDLAYSSDDQGNDIAAWVGMHPDAFGGYGANIEDEFYFSGIFIPFGLRYGVDFNTTPWNGYYYDVEKTQPIWYDYMGSSSQSGLYHMNAEGNPDFFVKHGSTTITNLAEGAELPSGATPLVNWNIPAEFIGSTNPQDTRYWVSASN